MTHCLSFTWQNSVFPAPSKWHPACLQGPWRCKILSKHFNNLLRHVMKKHDCKCHWGESSQKCPQLSQLATHCCYRHSDNCRSQGRWGHRVIVPYLRSWLPPCSTHLGQRGLWSESTMEKKNGLVSYPISVGEQHLWGKTYFKSLGKWSHQNRGCWVEPRRNQGQTKSRGVEEWTLSSKDKWGPTLSAIMDQTVLNLN